MSALPLLLALAIGSPAKQPAWLDFSIASYIMRYDETHSVMAVHDKRTGYFLARTVECDGGVVTLTLTRDRSEIDGMGFDIKHDRNDGSLKVIEKPLPNLSTGRGVKIGDSPATVRRKLGKPTDVEDDKFLTYTYTWDNDLEYNNVYIFKKSKLIEITFWRDSGLD